MNIIEVEDQVKGLPDEVLIQKAQQPDGSVPTYLVMSELQRRTDMRKRHQAMSKMGPKPTIKDQILQQGIAGLAPQGGPAPSQTGMPAAPGGGGQQAGEPMMKFAEGGLTTMRFADGGPVYRGAPSSSAMEQQLLGKVRQALAMGVSLEEVASLSRLGTEKVGQIAREMGMQPSSVGTAAPRAGSSRTSAYLDASPEMYSGQYSAPARGIDALRAPPGPSEEDLGEQKGELFQMADEDLLSADKAGYEPQLIERERARRGLFSPSEKLDRAGFGTLQQIPRSLLENAQEGYGRYSDLVGAYAGSRMKTGEMAMNAYDWLTTPTSDSPPSQSQIEPVGVPQMERRPMPGGQPPSGGDSSAALGILSTIPGLSAGRPPAMSSSRVAPRGQGQPPSAPPASAAPAGVSALPGGTGAAQSGEALNPAEAPIEDYLANTSGIPDQIMLDTSAEQGELADYHKGLITEADDRAKQILAQSEARGEKITEEAKDEAFNQALISLGVGIGRGDLIGGLQQAGTQANETRGEAKDEVRALRKEAEQAARAERKEARKLGQKLFEQELNLRIGDKKSRIEQRNALRAFATEKYGNVLRAAVRGAGDKQAAEIRMRQFDARIQQAKLDYLREREKQDALSRRNARDIAADIVEQASEMDTSIMEMSPRGRADIINAVAADLMAGSLGDPEDMSERDAEINENNRGSRGGRPPLSSIFD